MSMKKKYAICPGYVTSKNDGERHFINATELMRLYGVNPAECVIFHDEKSILREGGSLIILRPDYDGDYTIKDSEK